MLGPYGSGLWHVEVFVILQKKNNCWADSPRPGKTGRLYNGNSRDLANETSDTKTSGPKTRATLTSRCNPEKAAGLKPGATKEARPRQLVCVEVVVVFALGPLREFPLGNIDNP